MVVTSLLARRYGRQLCLLSRCRGQFRGDVTAAASAALPTAARIPAVASATVEGVLSTPGTVSLADKPVKYAPKGVSIPGPGLYWKLAKGKLTTWVALSALPGYFLALPAAVDPVCLGALVVGTVMTSSSAQAMNQIIEINRDRTMQRTALRPLPTGQLSVAQATAFAATSGAGGLAILGIGASPVTAMVAAATMATYAGMYTPMKVLSPYNTHIGAISGSLPTLMGFTAALGGAGLAASPWCAHASWVFGMQTLWQMPHFYALACFTVLIISRAVTTCFR